MEIERSKVGVFCIDKSYFLYHMLGIGFELTRQKTVETYFFCTPANRSLVQKLAIDYGTPNINIVDFRGEPLNFNFATLCELIPRPLFRPYLFKLNRKQISKMDAFVVPLYDYLVLKNSFAKRIMIYTTHGMPSGNYAFDNRITKFELFFLSSLADLNERNKRGQLTDSNHKVIGFSKYDLIKNTQASKLFNNQNKIILYNPHWERRNSSFKKFGFEILDFFSKRSDYNLVFSPHSKLINRKPLLRYHLNKYKKFSNIIVDLNSERNNDMTYTRSADLYLGDVSSQALEYLFLGARPCLFIDAHNLQNGNVNRPLTWDLGNVIDNVINLDDSLQDAFESHTRKYMLNQVDASESMFFKGAETPSEIAAEAIADLLKKKTIH